MQIFHINHIFHKATKNYPSVIALQKKYQLSSQTVDIIEITSDLHRHEGVDQEYTAVYFLTTKSVSYTHLAYSIILACLLLVAHMKESANSPFPIR